MLAEDFHLTPDGLRIWHSLTGAADGPTLVLCDGIACDGFIWPYVIDHFSAECRILRWHYRGHGRSDAPDDDVGTRLVCLTDDLAAIMQARGLERAVIVGHSMGVQVALEFFRRHRDATDGLALLCGAYGRPLSTFHGRDTGERMLPWIRALVERAPGMANALWARLVPTNLSFRLARRTEIHPTRARRWDFFPYLEHVARMDLRVFLSMLTHAAAHTAEDVLETIDVPTLIVAGDADGFTPGELSAEMAERIPGAELVLLPGGTHTAPIEFPDEVNAALAGLLQRVRQLS